MRCLQPIIYRGALLALFTLLFPLTLTAQPKCEVTHYDELNSIASSTNRILQGKDGMIWLATTNGICRFDGYGFDIFKTHPGDGINVQSDNINRGSFDSLDNIWCQIESRVLHFDTHNCQFTDVLSALEKTDGCTYRIKRIRATRNGFTWLITDDDKYICIADSCPANSAKTVLQGVGKIGTIVAGTGNESWLIGTNRTYIYRERHLSVVPCNFRSIANSGNKTWVVTRGGKLCYYDKATNRIIRLRNSSIPGDIQKIKGMSGNRLGIITNTHLCVFNTSDGDLTCDNFTYRTKDIREDGDGNLWILSREGFLLGFRGGKLYRKLDLSVLYHAYWYIDHAGNMWFIDDSGTIYYLEKNSDNLRKHPVSSPSMAKGSNFFCDSKDNVWLRTAHGVFRLSFRQPGFTTLPCPVQPEDTKAMMADHTGHYWISAKDAGTVRIYNSALQLTGYLNSEGGIQQEYCTFGAKVYCMVQDKSKNIWLGCKPEGLYRLTPKNDGTYHITHFDRLLNSNDIHDMLLDKRGRLWVATISGGVNCVTHPESSNPQAYNTGHGLNGLPTNFTQRATSLCLTHDNKLVVGTKEGLLLADINAQDVKSISFKRHFREPGRTSSLGCGSINSIFEDSRHRVFVCTESNGTNQIVSDNLLDNQLSFLHYNTSNGGGTDCALRMFEENGQLYVIAPDKLIRLQTNVGDECESSLLLANDRLAFVNTPPIRQKNGQWLIALDNGTISILPGKQPRLTPNAPLVITSAIIPGEKTIYDTNSNGAIVLPPGRKDININFARLNYSSSKLINYAFRMEGSKDWTYLGTGHSILLSDLNPGTIQLDIRSTNGNGEWTDNIRTIDIIVKPTFWQSGWGILTIAGIIAAILGVTAITGIYVHRIKKKHRELLEVYLRLVNPPAQEKDIQEKAHSEAVAKAAISPRDDAFMQKVLAFVEKHIADSDANIDNMSSELAISRSGLNRKTKLFFGITPIELLREARIRRAEILLKDDGKTVNEIAYDCGFSDPKYFSKCFKASTGKTPSEYRGFFMAQ